jgi:hypothetical protein
MGGARPDTTPEDIDRLRGVRVARVDSGRIIRVVAVAVIVILAVSALALTVSAVHQNDRLSKLQHHGTPVQATVTGCVGISSGIAMAIEYWECRGSYSLDGHRYNEVIRGSRAHLTTGRTVPAVAVPGDPTLLSTVAAAGEAHSAGSRYIAPVVLGVLAVLLAVALLIWSKRRPASLSS